MILNWGKQFLGQILKWNLKAKENTQNLRFHFSIDMYDLNENKTRRLIAFSKVSEMSQTIQVVEK